MKKLSIVLVAVTAIQCSHLSGMGYLKKLFFGKKEKTKVQKIMPQETVPVPVPEVNDDKEETYTDPVLGDFVLVAPYEKPTERGTIVSPQTLNTIKKTMAAEFKEKEVFKTTQENQNNVFTEENDDFYGDPNDNYEIYNYDASDEDDNDDLMFSDNPPKNTKELRRKKYKKFLRKKKEQRKKAFFKRLPFYNECIEKKKKKQRYKKRNRPWRPHSPRGKGYDKKNKIPFEIENYSDSDSESKLSVFDKNFTENISRKPVFISDNSSEVNNMSSEYDSESEKEKTLKNQTLSSFVTKEFYYHSGSTSDEEPPGNDYYKFNRAKKRKIDAKKRSVKRRRKNKRK